MHCAYTVHAFKNIKNWSHDTIHTFKNYFVIIFSVFSSRNNKFNPNGPKYCLHYENKPKQIKRYNYQLDQGLARLANCLNQWVIG